MGLGLGLVLKKWDWVLGGSWPVSATNPHPLTIWKSFQVQSFLKLLSCYQFKAFLSLPTMSTPGLPVSIAAATAAADDASVLTGATSKAVDPPVPFDHEAWSTPHSGMAELFLFEKRAGKSKSQAWNFFHLVKGLKDGVEIDNEELPINFVRGHKSGKFACCNECGLMFNVGPLSIPSKWSPSSLVKHITKHNGMTLDKLVQLCGIAQSKEQSYEAASVASSKAKVKSQQSLQSFVQKEPLPHHLKTEHQQLCVVKFLVEQLLPFNCVEQDSFRKMIASFNKQAKPMSNKRVKQVMNLLTDHVRSKLNGDMKHETVSFTTDHWTSHANQNFSAMTAHWIDNTWTMNSVTLGMFLHEGRSTSEALAASFVNTWKSIGMEGVKVQAGTTDTEAAMNQFGMELEGAGISHIYCTDHVLQLTAKLVYSDESLNQEGAQAVKKARGIVTFINKSTQANEKLKQKQTVIDGYDGRPKTVVTDVVTRWWSTHAMIERLLELRPAIDMMANEGHFGDTVTLSTVDWNNLEHIMKVLTPFKNAQKMMEGNHYVTAGWVLVHVQFIRQQLTAMKGAPNHRTVRTLAGSLLEDFETRWKPDDEAVFDFEVQRADLNRQTGIHPLLVVASFLDPRFKQLNAIASPTNRKKVKTWVKKLMTELENKRRNDAAPESQDLLADSDVEEELQPAAIHTVLDSVMDIVGEREQQGRDATLELDVKTVVNDEFKAYEREPKLELAQRNGKLNDPLEWWKENQHKFPLLAKLARSYLAVQATSAPSERVFSIASRVISKLRTQMNPKVAEQLLFLNENWGSWEIALEDDLEVLQLMSKMRLGQPKEG